MLIKEITLKWNKNLKKELSNLYLLSLIASLFVYIVNTHNLNVLVSCLEINMILMYTTSLSNVNHLKLLINTRYYIYSIKNYMKTIITKNLPTQLRVTLLMNQMNTYAKKIITLLDLLNELTMNMVMMDTILHLHWGTGFTHLLTCTECLCTWCYGQVIVLVYLHVLQDVRMAQMC